jgi:16S rRNA processing protein RimM
LSPERVQIGRVLRAHGVRGLVRVRAGAVLAGLKSLFLDGKEYKIERATPERGDFLVQLAGVTDRTQADALRGRSVEVARGELPPLADDELYVSDLVGCRVFDARGALLGEVRDVFHSGAHEVLVVAREGGEFMLPLVDAMVTEVDLPARRVVCDPPPGLVDLDEAET